MGFFETLGLGLLIVLARTVDVTIGTIRVISVIDGRMRTAFALGFLEVLVWLVVISATLSRVEEHPVLMFFFAFGFALGNILGILVERALPIGNLTLRIVGGDEVRTIAAKIRDLGLGATLIRGEGRDGERNLLFSFMPKKFLKRVQPLLYEHRERIFYTFDYGGSSNRILLPQSAQPASPRRFFKRK